MTTDTKTVVLDADLYLGRSPRPFLKGSTVTLDADLADKLISIKHAHLQAAKAEEPEEDAHAA